jgi:hypothetical protein
MAIVLSSSIHSSIIISWYIYIIISICSTYPLTLISIYFYWIWIICIIFPTIIITCFRIIPRSIYNIIFRAITFPPIRRIISTIRCSTILIITSIWTWIISTWCYRYSYFWCICNCFYINSCCIRRVAKVSFSITSLEFKTSIFITILIWFKYNLPCSNLC